MGQAKRRGTYEQRVEQSKLAQQVIEKAFTDKYRSQILRDKFNGNRMAFANAIVQKQKGGDV